MGGPVPLRLCTALRSRTSSLGQVRQVGRVRQVGDSGFVEWAGGGWRGDEASPRVHGDRRAGENHSQWCSRAGGGGGEKRALPQKW